MRLLNSARDACSEHKTQKPSRSQQYILSEHIPEASFAILLRAPSRNLDREVERKDAQTWQCRPKVEREGLPKGHSRPRWGKKAPTPDHPGIGERKALQVLLIGSPCVHTRSSADFFPKHLESVLTWATRTGGKKRSATGVPCYLSHAPLRWFHRDRDEDTGYIAPRTDIGIAGSARSVSAIATRDLSA